MENDVYHALYKKRKCSFTKNLRRTQTPAETILWTVLRNRQYKALKFRRQVNIGPYIVDFLCKKYKVVLEIDGDIHDQNDQKEHDDIRTTFLNQYGYTVLRIKNEHIYADLDSVLQNIYDFVSCVDQTVPSPSQRRGLG